jgi:hypothetical protein
MLMQVLWDCARLGAASSGLFEVLVMGFLLEALQRKSVSESSKGMNYRATKLFTICEIK